MYTFGDAFGPIINIIDIMPPRQHCIQNMAIWKIAAYRIAAIVLFVLLLPIFEIIHILSNPDVEGGILFKSMFLIIGCFMISLRAMPINLNATAILNLIKQYENMYNDLNYSDQIQTTLKTIYYCIRCIAVVTFFSSVCIIVAPAFSDPPFSGLPFPGILNIDTSTSPNYEFVYIYQIIIELLRIILFFISTFVILGLMFATTGLFNELNNNLKNNNLVKCVKFHQEILRLFDEFESLFVFATLVSLGGTTLFLAISVYYVSIMTLSLDTFGFVIVVFLMTNELLLYNYCGNKIEIQHDTLATTLYTLNWYESLNKKDHMRNILIMMQGLNRPIQFRAGKIFPLSFVTFVAIMKTTYSYFTILRNINQ